MIIGGNGKLIGGSAPGRGGGGFLGIHMFYIVLEDIHSGCCCSILSQIVQIINCSGKE